MSETTSMDIVFAAAIARDAKSLEADVTPPTRFGEEEGAPVRDGERRDDGIRLGGQAERRHWR